VKLDTRKKKLFEEIEIMEEDNKIGTAAIETLTQKNE